MALARQVLFEAGRPEIPTPDETPGAAADAEWLFLDANRAEYAAEPGSNALRAQVIGNTFPISDMPWDDVHQMKEGPSGDRKRELKSPHRDTDCGR